jgi:hypothetical protein
MRMFRFNDERSKCLAIWIMTAAICALLVAAALTEWRLF